MADVFFVDNTTLCVDAISDTARRVLEECAAELESATKRNTRVGNTGNTKNSWQHKAPTEDGGGYVVVIGSDYINAIWEEFGTGEYALHGDGRKGGWKYESPPGSWHFTRGKRPSRAFQKAYDSLKNPIIEHIQAAFRGLG